MISIKRILLIINFVSSSFLLCDKENIEDKNMSKIEKNRTSKIFSLSKFLYYGSCLLLIGVGAGIGFLLGGYFWKNSYFFNKSLQKGAFLNNSDALKLNFINKNVSLFIDFWKNQEGDNFTHPILNRSNLEKIFMEDAGKNKLLQSVVPIIMQKCLEYYEAKKINKAALMIADLQTTKDELLSSSKYSQGDYDYRPLVECSDIKNSLENAYRLITEQEEVSHEVSRRLQEKYIYLIEAKGINQDFLTPNKKNTDIFDL